MLNLAYTSSYYGYDDLDVDSLLGGSYGSSASAMQGAGIWMIIAAILAIVGGILVYFLFVKSKTEPKGKFTKWLKDFLSFKIMWVEPIMKVIYYILTIYVILFSFSFLALGGLGVLSFFLCLIFGPIVVRLGYEFTMMFIRIWHNTQDISDAVVKKK